MFADVIDDHRQRLERALGTRYRIGELAGEGGMAAVFTAHDIRHDRRVAIKVFDAADSSSEAAARFLREVRIMAGFTHPAIVPVFDSGEDEGLLYYVMPLLPGETLRHRMRQGRIDFATAALLLGDVADALDVAHRHGVVHRDVKPENILLVEGRAMLADFGVAYAMAATHDGWRTRTGVAVGTPMYMSPEQLTGGSNVDGRADIFSLGCVLYEMVTGAPPHAHASGAQFFAMRATQPPALPTTIAPTDPLRTILGRSLSPEPDGRYSTAADFGVALRAVAHGSSVLNSVATLREVRVSRRRRVMIVVGAATCLIAGGTIAYSLSRRVDDASIAILPFANESSDRELDYFGGGLADELLSGISDIAGMRALSPTAASGLPERIDAKTAAKRLGVATVLEGAVHRSGDAIRVAVRLVDGRTGFQRWSHTYNGDMRDLFHVQDSIAHAVAQVLKGSLTVRVASTARTQDPRVHDLVLRAHYRNRSLQRSAIQETLALVDSAIALDSTYADAWALRSSVLQSITVFGDSADYDVLRLARDAAVRAATLDSTSADAQTALGMQLFRYDWNWGAAEHHLRRGIELNPRRSQGHASYSRFLRSMGRFDDALREIDLAAKLDPTVSRAMGHARIAYFARDYGAGRRELAAATPADSGQRTWVVWNAELALGLGDYASAESTLTLPFQNEPLRPVMRVVLYARTGRVQLARQVLDSLARSPSASSGFLAAAFASIGDRPRALDEIDRSIALHDPQVVDFKIDPLLDPLRSEPRFRQVMQRLAFP